MDITEGFQLGLEAVGWRLAEITLNNPRLVRRIQELNQEWRTTFDGESEIIFYGLSQLWKSKGSPRTWKGTVGEEIMKIYREVESKSI